MDMSGLVVFPLLCCFGIFIPTLVTGTTYGLITLFFNESNSKEIPEEKMRTILVITFALAFTVSCAVLSYITKDFYVMLDCN